MSPCRPNPGADVNREASFDQVAFSLWAVGPEQPVCIVLYCT
jgi:hypothetical protein